MNELDNFIGVDEIDELKNNVIQFLNSKIVPTELSPDFTNRSILIESVEDYIKAFPESKYLFLGHGIGTLDEVLDSYEFYLYILSFFNKVGKVFRSVKHISDEYVEIITVAYYNHLSNKIEICSKECRTVFAENEQVLHMYLLLIIKTIIHNILKDIVGSGLDIKQLELFKHKFFDGDEERDNID